MPDSLNTIIIWLTFARDITAIVRSESMAGLEVARDIPIPLMNSILPKRVRGYGRIGAGERSGAMSNRDLLQLAIVFFIVVVIAGTIIYGAYA